MKRLDEVFVELKERFPRLHDFRVLRHQENDQAFGDALLVLQNSELMLRLVRDKGQLFVDVGTDDVHWYEIKIIESILKGTEAAPLSMFDQRDDIEIFGKMIEADFAAIITLFAANRADKTISHIEQIKQKRVAKFLDRHGIRAPERK